LPCAKSHATFLTSFAALVIAHSNIASGQVQFECFGTNTSILDNLVSNLSQVIGVKGLSDPIDKMTLANSPAALQKSRKPLAILAAVVFFLLAFIFVGTRWPFRRDAVVKTLEEESFSKVKMGAFHQTYFPHPGCVLEHVVFQHNPGAGAPPLATIERLRIEGSFLGLFRGHVTRVLAEGLHILLPPRGSGEHFETPQRTKIEIDDLVADGAILEVASSQPQKKALQFTFREFTLSQIGGNGPASFRSRFSNPEPPGEISTSGKFGPWNADSVGKTPVSGEYRFENADLSVFDGIGGMLSSSGKFAGEIDHIEADGTTEVPLFSVTISSHQVDLKTRFHAVVNGENGDTFLQKVTADFGETTLSTDGSIAGTPGLPGKTASLDFTTHQGRIQDILLLFAKSPRAPMSGIVSFHAKVSLPPGSRPFLEKLELQGDFGIDAGRFTHSDTQKGVNSLSEGARGDKDHHKGDKADDDPETVLSDLKGHAVLKNGTATLSNLSFSVPGALAQMQGTYNLITEKIDLRGTLKTDAEVSKTTHGAKALMLKVLDPFFKNKRRGYTAPVKITGTYQHPSFGLDLGDQNHKPKVHISHLPDQPQN